jgi:hypothetical protein
MNRLNLSLVILGIVILVTILVGVLYRALFLNFVDNYEFGYMFDARKGELYPLVEADGSPKQGYIFSWPIVQSVHTIDTRPMQVCINANSRVLNCKLVQFDPSGLKTFVSWHGRGDYSVHGGLKDIMLSYAYDPSSQKYPFLKILKELKNQDVDSVELGVPQDKLDTPKTDTIVLEIDTLKNWTNKR